MSDDDADFFDSPRDRDSPKKYTWSKGDSASGNRRLSETKLKQANAVKILDDERTNPSKPKVIAKIPTGMAMSSSDSDSQSENEKSTRKKETKNRGGNEYPSPSKKTYSSSEYSDSYTDSGSDTERKPVVKKDKSKAKTRSSQNSMSRSSSSQTATDNTDSENEDNKKKTFTKDSESRSNRPKTGHSRSRSSNNSKGKEQNESNKRSDHSNDSSTSETDSDMTDVSPLNSPQRATPKHSTKKVTIMESSMNNMSKKSRPSSGKGQGYEHLLSGNKDEVNLKVLMSAILEMEAERDVDVSRSGHRSSHRAPSITHSLADSLSSNNSISNRRNMSFGNTRVRDIDRENQRLMKEILKFGGPKKKLVQQHNQAVKAPRVLTSASVNRRREQERIDRENATMLRRLESAKATSTLRRDVIDHDLNSTTYAGVPLGLIHAPKPGKPTRPRSAYTYTQRPTSTTSTASYLSDSPSKQRPKSAQPASINTRQRPRSAHSTSSTKQRPLSAHSATSGGYRPKHTRPAWEEGW